MGDFVSVVLGLDSNDKKINFQQSDDKYLGYKVMSYDPEKMEATSGANNRLRVPLSIGAKHSMPGAGVFISNNPDYVVDYYSASDEDEDTHEVVVQYLFKLEDVVHNSNQLGDINPEIGVRNAVVKDFIDVLEWQKGKRF